MHPIEREIASRIINAVLSEKGHTISVFDGEETVVSKSDDAKRILNEMCQTDDGDVLFINHGQEDIGAVYFCYGNEPEYVVADYSADKFTSRIVETVTMDYD
tara:strand:+ start:2268 stop:2573 length:306 start_codon:yes stop_codon:yes gene_type:complete